MHDNLPLFPCSPDLVQRYLLAIPLEDLGTRDRLNTTAEITIAIFGRNNKQGDGVVEVRRGAAGCQLLQVQSMLNQDVASIWEIAPCRSVPVLELGGDWFRTPFLLGPIQPLLLVFTPSSHLILVYFCQTVDIVKLVLVFYPQAVFRTPQAVHVYSPALPILRVWPSLLSL